MKDLLRSVPSNRTELQIALDKDPLKERLLRPLALKALLYWLESDQFKTRADYHGVICQEVFGPNRIPDDCYWKHRLVVLNLWKRFGWVTTYRSTRFTASGHDLEPETLAKYASMSRSNDPDISRKGSRLLDGSHKHAPYLLSVDFAPLIEGYLADVGVSTVLGRSQSEVVEEHNLPPRLVKKIFAHLRSSGMYEESVKKIGGRAKRVLEAV